MGPKTPGGYDLFEVLSALQKCIRRSLELEAMRWASELCDGYWEALWNRLTVIANEDIGIANPMAILLVEILRKQATASRENESGAWKLMLANAILFLSRSPKSRLADNFQCCIFLDKELNKKRLEIPDFALDKHTRRGKEMGRGVDHWLEEGCKLNGIAEETPIDLEYEKEAAALWRKAESLPPRQEEPKPKKEKKGGPQPPSVFGEEE